MPEVSTGRTAFRFILFCAAVALVSAQIALAGIGNLVDFDQTVEAMRKVGRTLPFELRESALGGIAAAPTACAYCPGCN